MRDTPIISNPAPKSNPKRPAITEAEIKEFLKRKRWPSVKRYIQRARRKLQRRKYLQGLPRQREVSVSQTDKPWQFVYGKTRVGGVYSFLRAFGGSSHKEKLGTVVTYACHQITSVEKLWLDENLVSFSGAEPDYGVANGGTKPDGASIDYSGLVWLYAGNKGTSGQSAYSEAVSDHSGFWTTDHRQREHAHTYIRFKYNAEKFPNGEPDIALEVKGKPVYDPRTGLTTYSANAALIIADYLTNSRFGMGYDWSEIDTDSLESAADVCDEAVSLKDGGTEPRYEINRAFDVDDDHEQVLAEMEAAIAGSVTRINGKWKFFPGVYTAPVLSLTEEDLRSDIEIEVLQSGSDVFNSVRGQYVSSENKYVSTDYPAVSVAAYVAADNAIVNWEDINLSSVTSATQAQRCARIALERSRRQIRVKARWSLKAFQLEPGDTIGLTLESHGWADKEFTVDSWSLVQGDSGAFEVEMELQEFDSGVFGWNPSIDEQQVNIAPTTDLPDPRVIIAPTGLTLESGTDHLYTRKDGTIFTRVYASWNGDLDPFVSSGGKVEVHYKYSSQSTWRAIQTLSGDASETYILDVQDGLNIDVRIRNVSALGVPSAWTQSLNHLIVGKTEKPSDVTGFAAVVTDDGIKLTWTQISDLDRSEYEIRSGASWAAGTVIYRGKASDGTAFVYQYRTAGTVTLRIKAIDTTGNYSNADSSISVTLTGPNPVRTFTASALGQNVLLDWLDPIASTFAVNRYDVYKGDTLADAVKIGTVFGTFHTYVERTGGTFTYWAIAVDIGGNRASALSAQVTVAASTDFYINDDQDLLPSLTSLWLAADVDGGIIAPYGSLTPTVWLFLLMLGREVRYPSWQEHFENNGWTTIQDAIDDGYTRYLQPVLVGDPGVMTFEVDYGLVFSTSFIDFTWTETKMGDGDVTVVPSISLSEDGTTWTEYASVSQAFGENFRYARFTLSVTAEADTDVSYFSDFRAKLSLQRTEETQIINALSSDVSGTLVTFQNNYIDVEDIQVSVNSSVAAAPVYVYDFSITPAQNSMLVLVFDKDGNRITKEVTCRIRGALAGT
jgi:hypothetical protein